MQNIMLFLFAMPVQMAALQQPQALGTSDYILAALALVDVATEFVADNQQYSYQTFKHTGVLESWPGARIRWTQADVQRGFLTRGLWAWSRHPNFFCEQSFWVRFLITPFCFRSSLPYTGHHQPVPATRPGEPQAACTIPQQRHSVVASPADAYGVRPLLLVDAIHGEHHCV